MQLGNHISLPQVPDLGLGALEVDLPASDLRREVKIYKVPESVSADQYFISATEAGGAEVGRPPRGGVDRNQTLINNDAYLKQVAPHAGAWIETNGELWLYYEGRQSPPTRGRG